MFFFDPGKQVLGKGWELRERERNEDGSIGLVGLCNYHLKSEAFTVLFFFLGGLHVN